MQRPVVESTELVDILQRLDLDLQTDGNGDNQEDENLNLDLLASALEDIEVPKRFHHLSCPTQTRLVAPQQKHHELHFEYPAVGLMPSGASLRLVEPARIALRERPMLDDFLLDPKNLPIHINLPTHFSPVEAAGLRLPQTNNDNILEMIKSLSFPGISKMQIVYFKTHDGHMMYRTRLTTVWITSAGRSQPLVRDFMCNEDSWNMLLSIHPGEGWCKMLRCILERACDRSYLFVRETLNAKDSLSMHLDEQFLAPKWKLDKRLVGPAPMVLWCKLKGHSIKVEEEQGVGDMDIIQLPCGHKIHISMHYISSLTEEVCKAYACYHCGKRVFEQRHFDRVDAAYDWPQRDTYRDREKEFSALYARHTAERPRFTISSVILANALKDVLTNVMKLPASVAPSELDHSRCEITSVLLEKLIFVLTLQDVKIPHRHMNKTIKSIVNMSGTLLKKHYGLKTCKELTKIVPSGYGKFVVKWFMQTILCCWYRIVRQKKQDAASFSGLAQSMGGVKVENEDVDMKL